MLSACCAAMYKKVRKLADYTLMIRGARLRSRIQALTKFVCVCVCERFRAALE